MSVKILCFQQAIQRCVRNLLRHLRWAFSETRHKKWSFPLRISSVVTKSVVSCRFCHIYWKSPSWENFLCSENNDQMKAVNFFTKECILDFDLVLNVSQSNWMYSKLWKIPTDLFKTELNSKVVIKTTEQGLDWVVDYQFSKENFFTKVFYYFLPCATFVSIPCQISRDSSCVVF